MNNKGKVWLVTGTSSGLGNCLIQSVLRRGDYAVATVRRRGSLDDLAITDEQRSRLRILVMDVTASEDTIRKVVNEAWAAWGHVDVLVNNAGHGTKALMEEGGAEVMKEHFETNVFGVVKVTNAVLPHMRQRRSGLIVFLGSRIVWQASLHLEAAYIATKAAIHAISESLAVEVAQFGIRVLLAIPGGFRTSQLDTPYVMKHHVADYDGYREEALQELTERWKKAQGDPEKAMEALVDVIKGEGKAEGMELPPWLLLGRPTFSFARDHCEKLTRLIEEWEGVSKDLDYKPPL